MARNPLHPGEIGKIRTEQIRPGLWRADASFCDRSGAKGRCRKSGRTGTAARRALAEELKERIELEYPNGPVTPTSLVNEAIETYLTNRADDARNGIGRANPRSIKIYRSVARNWITPILRELQVRHLTPGRLDHYFRNEVPPTRYADVRKILHAFLKWLLVQGALQRDPLASLPSYQPKNIESGRGRRSYASHTRVRAMRPSLRSRQRGVLEQHHCETPPRSVREGGVHSEPRSKPPRTRSSRFAVNLGRLGRNHALSAA